MKHRNFCLLMACLTLLQTTLFGEENAKSENHADTKFLSAVHRFDGDFSDMEKLLSEGANIMARDRYSRTALHIAVEEDPRLIPFLVKHGAEIEARDTEGRTPLALAVKAPNVGFKCVQPLLDAGAEVMPRDRLNRTPLHDVEKMNPAMVRLLLAAGAEVDACADGDFTPLQIAVMNDASYDGMKALLEAGADVNARIGKHEQYTILSVAAKKGQVENCRLFLEHGAEVNAVDNFGKTALMDAARYPETCKLLLEFKADLTAKDQVGQTPLVYAVQENAQTAELLIDAGADVNVEDRYRRPLIILAAKMPDTRLFEKMLEKGADVTASDINGETLLHHAAEAGSVALCRRLLDGGADVNAVGKYGWTPVMRAIHKDEMPAVAFLLEHGADLKLGGNPPPEKRWNDNIKPPLVMAIMNGNPEMCRLLVRHGAEFLDEELWPFKSLCCAAESGSVALCEYVLVFNPSLEVRDERGRTPLMSAAEGLNLDVCILLLSRGADVKAVGSQDRRSALWRLQQGGFAEKNRAAVRIYELLLEADADVNARDATDDSFADWCTKMGDDSEPYIRKYLQSMTGRYAEAFAPPALHKAAYAGDVAEITRLLDDENAPADVNEKDPDGETALFHAIRGGSLPCVKLLLARGASLDVRGIYGGTPLHYAAGFGRRDILDFLLERHGKAWNLNFPDEKNEATALHWAVEARHGPCVIALVRAGADAGTLDKWNMSPFTRAMMAENVPYCRFMIDNGYDLNAGMKKIPYEYLLFQNINARHLAILKDCGLDFNQRDARRDTLLHYLAMQKWAHLMEYVLQHGGDPTAKNSRGETPIDVMLRYGTPANWVNRIQEAAKIQMPPSEP